MENISLYDNFYKKFFQTTPKLETTKMPSETGFEYEEDSNSVDGLDSKSNLCRLCGKNYARPSTLKTHLRTHSGMY